MSVISILVRNKLVEIFWTDVGLQYLGVLFVGVHKNKRRHCIDLVLLNQIWNLVSVDDCKPNLCKVSRHFTDHRVKMLARTIPLGVNER